jgi:hypothetical protein
MCGRYIAYPESVCVRDKDERKHDNSTATLLSGTYRFKSEVRRINVPTGQPSVWLHVGR